MSAGPWDSVWPIGQSSVMYKSEYQSTTGHIVAQCSMLHRPETARDSSATTRQCDDSMKMTSVDGDDDGGDDGRPIYRHDAHCHCHRVSTSG
mgnify:CR=1 FL=1